MPLYFPYFENGQRTADDVGVELATDEAIREEAMQALPEIAMERVPEDGDRQAFTVLVTDKGGDPVYTATLSFAGLWLNRD